MRALPDDRQLDDCIERALKPGLPLPTDHHASARARLLVRAAAQAPLVAALRSVPVEIGGPPPLTARQRVLRTIRAALTAALTDEAALLRAQRYSTLATAGGTLRRGFGCSVGYGAFAPAI